MRTCDEILEWLSAALDGQLTDEEQTELDGHLAHCPACSALFAELNTLHTATAQLEEVPAPDGFVQRVMAQIAAESTQEKTGNIIPFPAKKKSRAPWKGWTATAAAVAIVALGAISLPGQFSNKKDAAAPVAEAYGGTGIVMDGDFSITADQSTSFYNTETADAVAEQDVMDAQVAYPSTEVSKEDSVSSSYCATYVLTCDTLPPELEGYESAVDQDGNRTYLLPVDEFYALVESWKEKNAQLTDSGSVDPSAQYGRIIVKLP